jgi:hypothetical protein
MTRLFFVVFTLCFATSAFAHRDRLGKVSRAELTFEDGGTVVLTKERVALLSLALRTEAGLVEVKKEDLAGIEYPQLDSIKMTWSTFTSGDLAGVKYKCVSFYYGSEDKKAFGESPEVKLCFYDGKYHHRTNTKKTAPDTWSSDNL